MLLSHKRSLLVRRRLSSKSTGPSNPGALGRLLVVLSKHSMQSDWVKLEICKARKAERDGPRRKLFPIALVPYREIQQWQCLDPHTGEDLAGEIRQYFLPDDFLNWKDHESFERAFAALLRDLRAQAQS